MKYDHFSKFRFSKFRMIVSQVTQRNKSEGKILNACMEDKPHRTSLGQAHFTAGGCAAQISYQPGRCKGSPADQLADAAGHRNGWALSCRGLRNGGSPGPCVAEEPPLIRPGLGELR
jgi:hypothetical protein